MDKESCGLSWLLQAIFKPAFVDPPNQPTTHLSTLPVPFFLYVSVNQNF